MQSLITCCHLTLTQKFFGFGLYVLYFSNESSFLGMGK